jgi:hypothetical protein
MKPQREVLAALEETGLPWEITNGGRHAHIRVAGRLAGILPRGSGSVDQRAVKNCIAQIRRKAVELRGGSR